MKSLCAAITFLAFASSAFADSEINCFSKYYTANQATITIRATVVSNTELKNLVVQSAMYGLNFNLADAKGGPVNRSRIYKAFNNYYLGTNPMGVSFQPIDMYLPNNLTAVSGNFDGYVSDANADVSGSDGYQRVLCRTK